MNFRKILFVTLLLVTLLVTMSLGFAETITGVEKVVFKNMNANLRYLTLGGIRFYDGETMINSGEVTQTDRVESQTELFKITSSSTIASDSFSSYYSVLTSNNQLSGAYWMADLEGAQNYPNTNQSYTIEFKELKDLSKIEFVPRPSTDRGLTENFEIEVTTSNGSVMTYIVAPISTVATVQTLDLTTAPKKMYYNISTDKYEINSGDTIDVFVNLNNAENIYAQDFTVQYDTNAYELLNDAVTSEESYKIYHSEKSEGQVRYIIASNSSEYGVTGNKAIMKLTFKVKSFTGHANIRVMQSLTANANGEEKVANGMASVFKITMLLDVNRDGKVTLGDLAIASNLISKTPSEWNGHMPDTDGNQTIDFADLTAITNEILKY